MPKPQTKIVAMLRENGFALARQRRHQVWKRADGQTFVIPSTPSCSRAELNAISDLRRILGRGVKPPKQENSLIPAENLALGCNMSAPQAAGDTPAPPEAPAEASVQKTNMSDADILASLRVERLTELAAQLDAPGAVRCVTLAETLKHFGFDARVIPVAVYLSDGNRTQCIGEIEEEDGRLTKVVVRKSNFYSLVEVTRHGLLIDIGVNRIPVSDPPKYLMVGLEDIDEYLNSWLRGQPQGVETHGITISHQAAQCNFSFRQARHAGLINSVLAQATKDFEGL